MSRRLQALLFLVGIALFILLLGHVGLPRLLENVRQTGWMFAPIVAVYAGVYSCNALACWLVMADQAGRPSYPRTWVIMVSGFALSSVTPFLQVGGEPYKVGVLGAWLGPRRATGVVLTYYMLNTLSNILTWLAAVAAVLLMFEPPAGAALGLGIVGVALALLVAFVFSRHRAGIFGAARAVLARLPGLRRHVGALDRHGKVLQQLDEQIVGFYHRSPGRFCAALLIDFSGRTIGTLEYWLIARSVGVPIGLATAFVMGSLLVLGLNILFFMPFDVGSREGGAGLLFGLLGLPSSLGIYAGVVTRLRWAVWVAIGLALIWVARRPAPVRVAAAEGA